MNRHTDRDLFDRASRDEADLRNAQQASAGDGHHPVHATPPHGEPSSEPRSGAATATLAGGYEHALAAEREAWRGLPALPGDPAFDRAAWDNWRSAVEERDMATRLLINYAMSGPRT